MGTYLFLDPAQGYGVVGLDALAIAIATVVFASIIWLISRLHLVRNLTPVDAPETRLSEIGLHPVIQR
ncbi:MAG: hypothetical protein H7201_16580 [Candidatus Saccharibacteria bacterium]|nr:hypothetical protein [Microbacteriaceae bacterium]